MQSTDEKETGGSARQFEQETIEKARKDTRNTTIAASIFFPLFLILDYAIYPPHFLQFLVIRITVVVLSGIVFLMLRTKAGAHSSRFCLGTPHAILPTPEVSSPMRWDRLGSFGRRLIQARDDYAGGACRLPRGDSGGSGAEHYPSGGRAADRHASLSTG